MSITASADRDHGYATTHDRALGSGRTLVLIDDGASAVAVTLSCLRSGPSQRAVNMLPGNLRTAITGVAPHADACAARQGGCRAWPLAFPSRPRPVPPAAPAVACTSCGRPTAERSIRPVTRQSIRSLRSRPLRPALGLVAAASTAIKSSPSPSTAIATSPSIRSASTVGSICERSWPGFSWPSWLPRPHRSARCGRLRLGPDMVSRCGLATLLIPPRGAAGKAGLGALSSVGSRRRYPPAAPL